MKIELKNLKHMESLSEETNCFTATVYIDGKRAGEASNRGHGGCNEYHPFELHQRLADYAKTLPEVTDQVPMRRDENGATVYEAWTHQPNADSLIDNLVTEALIVKDLRKLLSGRVAVLRNGQIYQSNKVPAATLAHWLSPGEIEKTTKAMKAEKVLNVLPFDEALKIYKSVAPQR
jgi:hypothetical protein